MSKTMQSDAWKEYEIEIDAHFRSQYPGANITHNAHLRGVFSKTLRQIDVLIEAQPLDFPFRIVVEGRLHKRKIDISAVEAFISKLRDVQAHLGIFVSPAGYTTAAKAAAKNTGPGIYLEIFTPAELKVWQGPCAIPYSGSNGALLSAPLGWIFDGSKTPGTLARIYRRGLDQTEAVEKREFMYINFWAKSSDVSNLAQLLVHQEKYMMNAPHPDIKMMSGVPRKEITALRVYTRTDFSSTTEITGFVEFEFFILMVVLLGKVDQLKENMRRVRFVLSSAIPLSIHQEASVLRS